MGMLNLTCNTTARSCLDNSSYPILFYSLFLGTHERHQFAEPLSSSLHVAFGAGLYMPLPVTSYHIQVHHSW